MGVWNRRGPGGDRSTRRNGKRGLRLLLLTAVAGVVGFASATAASSHPAALFAYWPGSTDTSTSHTPSETTTSESTTTAAFAHAPQVDLVIAKTASDEVVTRGSTFTYTLSVRNEGRNTATAPVVVDELPAGVTLSADGLDERCSYSPHGRAITCRPGDLEPGAPPVEMTFAAVADSAGTITNTASIAAGSGDVETDSSDNTASVDVEVRSQVDLKVSQTATPNPATEGRDLTYHLLVGNHGDVAAAGAVVHDTLPAGVSYVSSTRGVCSYNGERRVVTCLPDALEPGGQPVPLTIVVHVGSRGVISNTATIEPGPGDVEANPDDNTSTLSIDAVAAVPRVDLSLDQTAPAAVLLGTEFTYAVTVANGEADASRGALVTDVLPAGVTYVSSSAGCSFDSGTVTCAVGDLAGGADAPFTIVVRANALGTATNTASLTPGPSEQDASTADDSSTVSTEITALAPLAPPGKTDAKLTMSAPTFVRTGQLAAFTVNVGNGGPDTATGVVLHAPVPAGAILSSVTSSTGVCSAGATATCFIGTLAPGASATVTITLSRATAGSLILGSTVDADNDTDHGNNAASATVAVVDPNAVPPPPPPSSSPGTFNAVGTGTVVVNGVTHPADQPLVLNAGDVVDVTGGIITLTDSDGKYGSWSSVELVPQRSESGVTAPALGVKTAADQVTAKFTIQQAATPGALTTLTLPRSAYSVCTSPRSEAAKNSRPVQQLWGSAHGNFKTVGRFSAATVRGTFWEVQDRCDGTLTRVVEGIVDVHDATLNKDVSVGPGQSYLALAPVTAAFKPPAATPSQTPRQVTARGLVWGTKLYATRRSFEAYLKAKRQTWQQFAKAYPRLAAALSKRKA